MSLPRYAVFYDAEMGDYNGILTNDLREAEDAFDLYCRREPHLPVLLVDYANLARAKRDKVIRERPRNETKRRK